MLEVESSGYIHDAYIVEDEGPINYYDNLKKKVWNIPKNFLEVRSEGIGKGKYGTVVKGSVKQRGSPVPVSVHYIADEFCKHPNNKPMLEDFDKLIRTSPHTNVIGLIGTSEIPDALLVVLEYHPATLKDILLESRCLDQDGLSHSKDKFCSLQESHLLEISIGVARGMDHLIQKKIVHGKLCARSVAMADGVVPKICGFGLADIAKNSATMFLFTLQPLDLTRWTAQEIFRGRHLMTKSDIWSFGCLLWEIITFGGTLFPDVPSRDVPTRVMRGVRPMRPSYVGDDLYQFMLQCWQIDLDERPNFSEATRILINMLQDSEIHLNFSTYAGFHYEPYIPELEYLK
ncbi:hypothetical protein J437_LFUL010115 [Ladona fulva]|uniref:Protein kinase domain-containing protein n=1 Tax=Ladona fulva TaxID=123851 RepID=A0A8K0KJA8_LADFU|nr:hypothetical protein J437_LFUL010115 [Ladona fulva]